MTSYLVRRIGTAVMVIVALSFIAFGMVRLIPGDPAMVYLNVNDPSPEALAQIRSELGLDRSWFVQYWDWMSGILTGDLGSSLTRPYEIGEQLATRLPASLQLAVCAMIVAVALGVPAGVIAAVRSGRPADAAIRGTSFVLLAIPAFVIGTVVILVNSMTLKLPLVGYVPLSEGVFRSIASIAVPVVVLALSMGSMLARYTRNTVIDALAQDYVRTARAKGASSTRIVIRHTLRNGLIPVVTIIGVQLGALIGGTIVVENVFAIPGMGSMLVESINSTDYPVIQTCVLVLGAIYVTINLAVDLLYPLIDPRIRAVS
ncbi:ABC transporter permease [Rhodococcus gannanensis]|uniref:ABC transporter permease n=1 Tax=Rhodococcus gannanensis TaxID=1960308 RepID=A0ABW4P0J5_9NOCA